LPSPPSLLIPKTSIQKQIKNLNLDRPDYFSFLKLAPPTSDTPDSLNRPKQTRALVENLKDGETKVAKLTAKGINGFL
jgi:hypothetical protein